MIGAGNWSPDGGRRAELFWRLYTWFGVDTTRPVAASPQEKSAIWWKVQRWRARDSRRSPGRSALCDSSGHTGWLNVRRKGPVSRVDRAGLGGRGQGLFRRPLTVPQGLDQQRQDEADREQPGEDL